MAFELDPIFHTETMVKILQSQGHWHTAARVCEKILEKSPDHTRLRGLLETLRNGGRVLAVPEDEVTDPGVSLESLNGNAAELPVQEDPEAAARREKLQKLHSLLQKIQERS